MVFSPPTVNLKQKVHVKVGEPRVAIRDIVLQFMNALTSVVGTRPLGWMYETVGDAPVELRRELSALFRVPGIKLCGSCFAQNWRPRLYWFSWHLVREDAGDYVEDGDGLHFRLPMRLPPPEMWLDPGAEMQNAKAMLPTIVRALPRSQPGVGMNVEGLSDEAIGRWRLDMFRYPAYQYEQDCLVKERDGSLRPPSSTEREMLLGYPRDHTYPVISRRLAVEREDCRCQVLGVSPQVPMLMWLFGHWLAEMGVLTLRPTSADIARFCGWHCHQNSHEADAQALVRFLMSRATRKTLDVRVNLWKQGYKTPIAQSMPSGAWYWKAVIANRWKDEAEHINTLELRAFLLAVKWLLRQPGRQSSRVLHLTDSQVVMGTYAKGRAKTAAMRLPLRRMNAMLLAAELHL
eukprot:6477976-Amphidinium_carterae.1